VPSGRSEVGTGGVDTILDADTVDELSGVSGPSRRARARGTADRATSGIRERANDAFGDFIGDNRGQTGRFRQPESRQTPDAPTDFGRTDRVSDNLVQQSLNRQQRAGRDAVDGGDFEGVGDPFGPGTRRGTISERGEVDIGRSTAVVDEVSTEASAEVGVGFEVGGGLAAVNDPSGISDTATPTAQPSELAPLGELSPQNDPSGVTDFETTPGGDQASLAGGQRGEIAALGTLAAVNDVSGVTDGTGFDATNDTRSRSDTTPATDQPVGSGTDQPPASDTDQPPASDTDQPPATDAPPVTATPVPPALDIPPATTPTPTPTPRPPRRPPAFPPARPPRRPPRPPRDEEEDRDQRRQPEPTRDNEFRLFERVDAGGPAVGFGAETFAALGTGAFGEREVAEESVGEFYAGELPAASFLNPDEEDEEGVAFVSNLFGLNFGGGGG